VAGGAFPGIDAVHRGDQAGGHGPVQCLGNHDITLFLKVLAFLRGEGELQATGIHDAALGGIGEVIRSLFYTVQVGTAVAGASAAADASTKRVGGRNER
jgi:hypothetical protein